MDKATPVRARCQTHPGVAAVAYCDACGRALCLDCAIPVRGEVVGSECLKVVLPDSPAEGASPPPAPRRSTASRVALGGLALAAAATAFPWSRFGVGSSRLGAWGTPMRYSTLVGPVALAGLVGLWFASRPRAGRTDRAGRWIAIGAGFVVALSALLALLRPPPFTHANVFPFVALLAGVLAATAGPAWGRVRPYRSKRAVA